MKNKKTTKKVAKNQNKPPKKKPIEVKKIETEEESEIVPKKIISAIEIDEVDAVTEVEEKPENDILLPEEEDDSFSPDDEEIDPFGDKWEQ